MAKCIFKFFRKMMFLCWKLIEILFVLVVMTILFLLYHLHNQSVDVMKYIPEIENILIPKENGYHLEAESVFLTSDWSREGFIQIDIKKMKILRQDDTVVFEVPKATASYDLWNLFTLNYLPSTFILEKPFMEITIDEKGEVIVKTEASQARPLDFKKLKNNVQRVLGIHELQISDAHIRLKDMRFNQEWDMPKADLTLKRRFHFLQEASLNAILKGEGVDAHLLATADLNRFTKKLTLETGLDKINLQKISNFIPVLKEANLEIQLSLKGEFDFSKSHKKLTDYLEKLQFNAKTLKAGTLNLMSDLDNLYFVQSADINGTLGDRAKALKIASSKIVLKDEKPVDFYLDVEGIDSFLAKGDSSSLKTTLKATLYDVATEHIPSLWPSQQGPDAHAWVRQNLSKGKILRADFALYFQGDELIDLLGDIHAEGVRVDYLNPMKPVQNVSAQVLLYPDKVQILADKGTIGDLLLKKADLLFIDLDKDISNLQIDLNVIGPIGQALELISSKPLEFPQMFGLKPSLLSGKADTTVHLSFPLSDDLETNQVRAKVNAKLSHLKVNQPLEYLGLKNGDLSLEVTNEKLKISGNIMMKESPLKVEWQEFFEPKENSSEYMVSGTLKSANIGDLLPVLNPLIKGEIGVNLTAVKNAKTNLLTGNLTFDALNSSVDIAPLAVLKKAGNPMKTVVSFNDLSENLNRGKLGWDISGSLTGKTEDLKITGNAEWNDKKTEIVMTEVLADKNQFSGTLKSNPADFSLTLKGKNWLAYDLGKIFVSSEEEATLSDKNPKNILLDIELENLFLNKEKPIQNLIVSGKRKKQLWANFHLQAVAGEPFVLAYDPKEKQFHGAFSSLGKLMDYLNISDRFIGGELSLTAHQKETGMIEGQIDVKETELKETGFLIQALTILGIVDAFRGKDIVFDEIKIPFQLTPDFVLILKDAYAVGTNLGVTFKGNIAVDALDLSGAVVPAYAINSLPGKIPVVGWLFRDSEAGGLINVPYTVKGPLTNPEVSWNPLKTVAPGALGRLF